MRTAVAIASLLIALKGGGLAAAVEPGVAAAADQQSGAAGCGAAALDPTAARAVEEILAAGFRGRAADLAAVERIAASAGNEGQRDSRLEYARGLVLLKHTKYREAAEAFEAGAGARPPYLPAWQALIRTRLVLKEADAALERAERLAVQIAEAQGEAGWPDERCRLEAATWLGRVAGYLALDGVDLLDPPALLKAHEARVRRVLNPRLLEAHAVGRDSVYREQQALLAERAKQTTAIEAEQRAEREQRQESLQTQRAELDEQAETLQMTAREWQAWLDEQFRRTEKQLAVLQKDYSALESAARSVSREILERQRELTALRLQVDVVQSNARQPLPVQLNASLAGRENQISRLQVQFDTLAGRAQAVAGQARALLAERVTAARRFTRATGQLARQDATLQKWETLLEKSAEASEPKAATQTSRYRSLTHRLTLVATYFEFDPDTERKRLLEQVRQAP